VISQTAGCQYVGKQFKTHCLCKILLEKAVRCEHWLKKCIKGSILCTWKRRSHYQFSFLSKTATTNTNKNTHITEVSLKERIRKMGPWFLWHITSWIHNAASISLICMRTKTLEDVYCDVGLISQHLCEWFMEKNIKCFIYYWMIHGCISKQG